MSLFLLRFSLLLQFFYGNLPLPSVFYFSLFFYRLSVLTLFPLVDFSAAFSFSLVLFLKLFAAISLRNFIFLFRLTLYSSSYIYSTFYFSVFCLYTILLQDFVCVLIIAKSLLLNTTKSIKSIKSRFVLFFRLFKRFMRGKQIAILQNRLQKRGRP